MDESNEELQLEPHEPGAAVPAAGAPLVLIAQDVLAAMNSHAAEEVDHEIGGIMIGSIIEGDRPVVMVTASIRGKHMTYTRGSVTFTHETWSDINRIKDEQYADQRIVGWYHSHPGFGVFLSNYDLFIHKSFFTAPWQIAFVTDPKAKTYGCFTWQDGDLAAEPGFQVSAAPGGYEPAAQAPSAEPQSPAAVPSPAAAPAPRDAGSCGRGLLAALGLLGVLVALLAGLAMANYSLLVKLERRLGPAPVVVMPAPATPVTSAPTAEEPASEKPAGAAPETPKPATNPTEPVAPGGPTEGRSSDAGSGVAGS